MVNFQKKIAKKVPKMAKIPNFFIDPTLACLTSIQFIGMHSPFKIGELQVHLWQKNP